MVALSDTSFDGSFLPYGYSYLWEPSLVWLHAISSLLLAIAALSISITIFGVLYKYKKRIPYSWVVVLFATFIGLSGLVECLELIGIWKPVYYIEGIVKLGAAAIAIATAILIFPLLPSAVSEFIHNENKESDENKDG